MNLKYHQCSILWSIFIFHSFIHFIRSFIHSFFFIFSFFQAARWSLTRPIKNIYIDEHQEWNEWLIFSITQFFITDETLTYLVLWHDETRNPRTCNILCLRIWDLLIENQSTMIKKLFQFTLWYKKIKPGHGRTNGVTRLGSD